MYDSYFHNDVGGHGAGVTLQRSIRVDFFCDFPTDSGVSGGAMVLGKLPVPGRPTILIKVELGLLRLQ